MTILFSINQNKGYFTSKYEGSISDSELLCAYKDFFQGGEWVAGLNELCDLSEANLINITSKGLEALADYTEEIYKQNGHEKVKTAEYAPKDFHFGIARMYSAMADESRENVKVFHEIKDAENWLAQK